MRSKSKSNITFNQRGILDEVNHEVKTWIHAGAKFWDQRVCGMIIDDVAKNLVLDGKIPVEDGKELASLLKQIQELIRKNPFSLQELQERFPDVDSLQNQKGIFHG
jgi:hypothetical protein